MSECRVGQVISHQSSLKMALERLVSTLELFERFRISGLCHFPGMVPLAFAWIWFLLSEISLLFHFPQSPLKGESYQKPPFRPCFPGPICHQGQCWQLSCPSWCNTQRDSVADVGVLQESGNSPAHTQGQFSLFVCGLLPVDSWTFPGQSSGLVPSSLDSFRQLGYCTSECSPSLRRNHRAELTGWSCKHYLNSLA